MAHERILIVDDDLFTLELLQQHLQEEGFQPSTTPSGREAVALIRRERPDLVLLDVRLPDANGLALLKEEILPELGPYRVIILSADNARKDAEEAALAGAYDYLSKPVSLPRLGIAIRNCLRLQELSARVAALSSDRTRPASLRDLIGTSSVMVALAEQIKRVAAFDVPVLILGESGTGKELVARIIHALSPRRDGPFVPIDCGAVPDTLIEAEFFGYERGAFTGAAQAKAGKLERANGGTVLFDEIGNLPPLVQPKLLRALQFKEIERLGGTEPQSIDVRVLAATNAELDRMVKDGRFRVDLYHRLNIVALRVPSLRERPEDIPLLAHAVLMQANRTYQTNVRGFSPEALAALSRYPWPGNVRELENCLHSAVILADKLIEPQHLPPAILFGGGPGAEANAAGPEDGSLSEIGRRASEAAQRAAMLRVLAQTGWNRAEAARRLRVDYKSFLAKLQHFGIRPSFDT